MTVNKDRADSWNVSKPHSSNSCGGAEHIDIGRFDSDGKRDESFGKHHIQMSDVGEFVGVLKDIISGKN